MSATIAFEQIRDVLDDRTLNLLERRRGAKAGLRRRGWLIRRALLLADCGGLALAFGAAQAFYLVHVAQHGALSQPGEFVAFALSLPAWVVAAKLYGLYDKDEERTDHSTADEFSRLFHLITVGTFLLYLLAHTTQALRPEFGKLALFWVLAIVSTVVFRAAARAWCRRRLQYLQNTIIVGAGRVGQQLALKVLNHPEYGLNLVGFVDASPLERHEGLRHVTVLGRPDELPELVSLLDVERVIYAFCDERHYESLDLIRRMNEIGVQVDIVPRFFEVFGASVDVHTVEGVPVFGLRSSRLPASSRLVKRCFDLVVAASGLVALAPLAVVVGVAIKLDSPGPVFFRQRRVGIGGRTFAIWKFRTMTADAEQRKTEFAHLNKHLAPGGDSRMFKIDADPRLTRVGRVLRAFSLDELPQLANVLRGHMALVGPRPLIADEHRHVEDWAVRRLDLRPGITGLWQVLGRDNIGFAEMVRLDYLYVTSWSLRLDLQILAKTVPVLARRGR